ncbi:MAG: class I adenylate-forming enzyme family protein [Candidatus Scalinduaceae bacterium]
MNLMDTFCKTVEKQPNHLAIVGPGKDDFKSYYQLREKIEYVADRLKIEGIGPGSCVGLHFPSGLEYIILTYAIWRCGACVVPIPVELVPEEKHRICREICLNTVVSKTETVSAIEPFQNGKLTPIFEDAVVVSVKSFREHPSKFFSINPAFLRFTSGTTGTSKGIVLSHETVYDRIHAANDGLCIGPKDRIIWLLSMAYHFTVSIVSYLSFGATIVLCKNHLGATIIQTTVDSEGTIIYGSPVHYEFMAQDRSSLMMPSLRLAISTAVSLRTEVAETFYNRFKMPLTEAYGIIEVGLPCISLDNPKGKRSSVGRVLPAYEIRMEDVGLGNDLKAIKLRGKGFIDAYYDPWQKREEIMPDGWFATGDLGRLDERGYLYILGRSKDVINVGGMKFFPQEVEVVLESHPAVKEACVFPHHHKRLGEIPHSRVVLVQTVKNPPTVIELKDYCRQHLTGYKIPENIQFVNTLIRTASGKPIRRESTINTRKEVACAH